MARQKTTSQKHAELKQLGKDAKQDLYEMLRLASEILSDNDYVDKFGGAPALMDHLQENEFAHFGGRPSLAELLRAYDKNPDRETWEKYRYDWWAMIELSQPAREGEPVDRINWKARAKELEVELERANGRANDYQQMTKDLREQVDRLTAEVSELRGRLAQLREMQQAAA